MKSTILMMGTAFFFAMSFAQVTPAPAGTIPSMEREPVAVWDGTESLSGAVEGSIMPVGARVGHFRGNFGHPGFRHFGNRGFHNFPVQRFHHHHFIVRPHGFFFFAPPPPVHDGFFFNFGFGGPVFFDGVDRW
jgi:hypothetical protein